ncbi:MAG: HAD-IIB family hydrolase [Deltaproteobacteria bacterium]|nr:MAG: HAD-IIB family hydrolase [Deltaproteobacteria bacterium]
MVDWSKRARHRILIFTDLDGTLLDDQTYDFKPALPALRLIHSLKIPLILVSSKTRAEIESLRKRLSLDSLFIAENGGGIFFPATFELPKDYPYKRVHGYNAIFIGRPIEEVLEKTRRLKENFDFKGFSEMPPEEIASVTGLKLEQAILASMREFDEPILLTNPLDDGEIFCKKASDLGLDCVHGGRFIHLFLGGNKGRAVGIVLNIYGQLRGPIFSIAIGDSPNDISMLKMADKAILMQDKDGTYIEGLDHPDLLKAQGNGPKAWNKVMFSILAGFS